MSKETDGLRFKEAESENFMGTEKTTIVMDGRSFIISGKNEMGKSRLFHLLLSGIDSKNMPSEIITQGEEKAYTKVVVSGEINGVVQEYTIEMFYTPKNRSGRIVLTDKDGNKVNSPKEVLKGLIGNISFDIFKFLHDTKPNKIKILKELSGVKVEIDKIDISKKKIFDDRTFLNRKVAEDESVMNNHGLTPDEIDLYSEPIDVAPIQQELDEISDKITQWNDIKNKTETFGKVATEQRKERSDNIEEIEHLEKQIQLLRERNIDLSSFIEDNEKKNKSGLEWLERNPQPDAKEISTRLSNANVHNTKHEKVKALALRQKALLKDKQTIQQHTSDIEKLERDKDKLLENSKLPIKGLTFNDEEILYNGLPMEEGQINTATLYSIGFEISKALNPTLKVILIRAASLFDSDHLKQVMDKAREQGYQVIAERVTDDKKMEIKFIEHD